MPFKLKLILLFFLMFTIPTISIAADVKEGNDAIRIKTKFTQSVGDQYSKEKYRSIGLFGAKFKAVKTAAKYLTYKGLLEHYEKKQNEIFCIATNEIKASISYEKFDQETNTYCVKINSEVTIIDFIKAEIKNLELEKEESNFSYSKEMEQPVSDKINPGEELSRAYRYIRKEQWRIAIIYLDNLERKYPYWGDVFLAKAIAYYGMDNPNKMAISLKKACMLNNQEACNELLSLIPKP